MTSRVQVRLHDGFATTCRVVAKLHGLGVAIDELHTSEETLCLHLHSPADEQRVTTVLSRCADAEVVEGQDTVSCGRVPASTAPARTHYVVWQEAGAAFLDRLSRQRRVSA